MWIHHFFHELLHVTMDMSVYLLLGFVLAGVLSVLLPTAWVKQHLSGKGLGPVIKAALVGVPMPLCSCGVIPVAAALRERGANRPASLSFLVSTPQTGVDSILVTASLLGWFFTIYRTLLAFITGIIAGAVAAFFPEEKHEAEQTASTALQADNASCCGAVAEAEAERPDQEQPATAPIIPKCCCGPGAAIAFTIAKQAEQKRETEPAETKPEADRAADAPSCCSEGKKPADETPACCSDTPEPPDASCCCSGDTGTDSDDAKNNDSCCGGTNLDAPAPKGLRNALKRMGHYGFVQLPTELAGPLVVGLLISAIISASVPDDFFSHQFGGLLNGGIIAMCVILAVSIPMYVCATASVPLALALINKDATAGMALVFLMAGPATNAATISALWRILGRRTTLIYLGTIIVGALAGGVLLDYLFAVTDTTAQPIGAEGMPMWISWGSTIAFAGLMTIGLFRRYVLPRMGK